MLDRLGLKRGAVIEDLEGVLASVGAAANPVTEIPFGLEAARALERSVQQALYLESNWVGTEHLLLGLLHDKHSPVARILGAHGAHFETAMAMVLTLLGEPTGRPQSIRLPMTDRLGRLLLVTLSVPRTRRLSLSARLPSVVPNRGAPMWPIGLAVVLALDANNRERETSLRGPSTC